MQAAATVAGFTMSSGSQSVIDGHSLSLSVPSGGTASVLVDATSRSSTSGGAIIIGWQWRIDGNIVASIAKSSQSLFAGQHTVALVITDSHGVASAAVQATIGILALEPPTAGFMMVSGNQSAANGQTLNVTVPSGGSAFVNVNANRSTAPSGTVVGWQWTIDGSSGSTTSSFSQSFSKGTHTIALIVTDNLGNKSAPASGRVLKRFRDLCPAPCYRPPWG